MGLARQRSRGRPARTREFHIAAPIGGVNSIAAGVDMPKSDLVYGYNVIGAEFGLRSRLGWREWCTGLGGEQVRSLLPFTGSAANGANDRLFACTTSGIWNVSASTQAPVKVVTFPISSADSGWGASCVFVTAAGHFLCYTDEANGYYVYQESGATWTAGGPAGAPVTGVAPGALVHVMPWKNRLWFVEQNSGRGWYLAPNAVGGAANPWYFGSRFKKGGELRGLYSWTMDGGTGMDDRIVAISGGGDVLIYAGTDPSQAGAFYLAGVWDVGQVPAYRRIATDYGGDMLIMSSLGIQPLSKLAVGNVVLKPGQYETRKISNLWQQLQAGSVTTRGWAMRLHPQDQTLLVLTPTISGNTNQQLAMSLSTLGWFQYRSLPIGVCAEAWGGSLYFGTDDGRVCINDGYLDGVTLATPGSGFSPIEWSILTAPTNLGSPRQKQVSAIRPRLLSQGGAIMHQALARYGWDLTEAPTPTIAAQATGAVWDAAIWDSATWAGSYQSQGQIFGASGIGAEIAIAVRGKTSSRMTLTGIDVAFEEGGFL